MRYAAMAVLLIVAGCQLPAESFVEAVDIHTRVILPEYETYVTADPELSPTDRGIRLASAESLRALIDAAKPKKEIKPDE